jgi:SPP1 family predicted phage head-tail adaptor
VLTYTDYATVWGAFLKQSGREFYAAQKLNAELTHLISIRYRTDVNPRWQLKFGARTLEILSAINVNEANEELQIACKEVV